MRHFLPFVLLALIGCGGNVEPSPAAADAGGDTVRIERDHDQIDRDAATDSLVVKETPKEIDSRQTVTFAVKNTSSADRWVVLRGLFCTALSIDGLSLQTGFSCGCECPNPGSPRVETYRRVAPGATYEVTWDARALVTYEETLDCSTWGPSAMPVKITRGVLQPVRAGTYTASIALEETVPSSCTVTGDEANCPFTYGGYGGSSGAPPGAIASLCESTKTATSTFVLPESGDVVVPVTLE